MLEELRDSRSEIAGAAHSLLARILWESPSTDTEKLEKVEHFLSLQPENRLRILCGGRMSPNDQEAAIKLLAQIVLDNGSGG